ncbi:MAG: HlyD family efflux transporter periplasmic adaptor subunit [Acutalibacteraceae bacterium]
MKTKKIKKIAIICLLLLVLLVLIFYFLYKKKFSIDFQIAELHEVKDSFRVSGIVVRDEEIITTPIADKSSVKYLLKNGDKSPKNGVIAEVYDSSESAKVSYRIDFLDREIKILEKLNTCKYNFSQSVNALNKKINEEVKNLLISVNDFQVEDSINLRNKILYFLNEKKIILGKNINFEDKIQELKKEKDRLFSLNPRIISEIKSPDSGVFFTDTDGYEEENIYKNLKYGRTNFSNLDAIDRNTNDNGAIGKLVKLCTWYIICELSNEQSGKIFPGQEVSISVEGLDTVKNLPCKIESLNNSSDSTKTTVLISCNYMNEHIASLWNEDFIMEFNKYYGLEVDKEAVFKDDSSENQFGVYVSHGNYLKFKKINPVYWKEDKVICAYGNDEYIDENYLQVGDKIIKGSNLYPGKKVK